jgi:hypothetical protein
LNLACLRMDCSIISLPRKPSPMMTDQRPIKGFIMCSVELVRKAGRRFSCFHLGEQVVMLCILHRQIRVLLTHTQCRVSTLPRLN